MQIEKMRAFIIRVLFYCIILGLAYAVLKYMTFETDKNGEIVIEGLRIGEYMKILIFVTVHSFPANV